MLPNLVSRSIWCSAPPTRLGNILVAPKFLDFIPITRLLFPQHSLYLRHYIMIFT